MAKGIKKYRPSITNFFPQETTLQNFLDVIKKSPELWNYCMALDRHIDNLECYNKELEDYREEAEKVIEDLSKQEVSNG